MSNQATDSVTVRPRVSTLALFAVSSFAAASLIRVLFDLDLTYPVAAALGGTFGYAISRRVTFAPTGLGLHRSFASWDDVVIKEGHWVTSLRSRPGVERRARVNVWLPAYLRDWRRHRVIEQVRVWAPHLDLPSER